MTDLKPCRKKMNALMSEYSLITQSLKQEKEALKLAKQREKHILEAQKIVQQVAESVQATAHKQIASVVSKCLQLVYGSKHGFKINFEQKRGRTEANIVIVHDGHELDPMTENAGGVVDVAAFGAQLTNLMLARPGRRKFLCLDEPFRNLHGKKYRAKIRDMLDKISKEMGVQMLILSQDSSDLSLGKVIEL